MAWECQCSSAHGHACLKSACKLEKLWELNVGNLVRSDTYSFEGRHQTHFLFSNCAFEMPTQHIQTRVTLLQIYDQVDGVTCHQCRQKTLGKRTQCSQCNSLFGQFCGDCLYMRYGENVDEVAEKVDWVCPCCRDLCNCSAHRSRAGWAPTGSMFRCVPLPQCPSRDLPRVRHLALPHTYAATRLRSDTLPLHPAGPRRRQDSARSRIASC
jgi:hypothetical protein